MVGISGNTGLTFKAAYAQAADLARLNRLRDRREVIEHQVNLPCDQVGDALRAALVGDMHDLSAGHDLEQLPAEMPGGAVAAGRVQQLAGFFFA